MGQPRAVYREKTTQIQIMIPAYTRAETPQTLGKLTPQMRYTQELRTRARGGQEPART